MRRVFGTIVFDKFVENLVTLFIILTLVFIRSHHRDAVAFRRAHKYRLKMTDNLRYVIHLLM